MGPWRWHLRRIAHLRRIHAHLIEDALARDSRHVGCKLESKERPKSDEENEDEGDKGSLSLFMFPFPAMVTCR